jgi:hypothetical protein
MKLSSIGAGPRAGTPPPTPKVLDFCYAYLDMKKMKGSLRFACRFSGYEHSQVNKAPKLGHAGVNCVGLGVTETILHWKGHTCS